MAFNPHFDSASLPTPDRAARAHSRRLCTQIQAALKEAHGWLPFDRYMEYALYAPNLGYYSGPMAKFGRGAQDGSDFITAPELSPLFAQALARVIEAALEASGTSAVMEVGAGSGRLAAQLLPALGTRCTHYTIIELSGALRARQRTTLAQCAPSFAPRVRWLDTLPDQFEGVIVGNEVLDALPVRLFVRRQHCWFERGIIHGKDTFEWSDRPVALNGTQDALACRALLQAIEGHHDYWVEFHQAARAWTRTLCTLLARGALLLIDYGFPRHEYYHPQRTQGTLMCHYRHRAHPDPFFYPGLQDITVHIDFSSIAEAAVQTGATLLGYTSQAHFLINSGITDALSQFDPNDPLLFLPAANAVHRLLSEAEMGELYKVMGFGRDIDPHALDFVFLRGDRSWRL